MPGLVEDQRRLVDDAQRAVAVGVGSENRGEVAAVHHDLVVGVAAAAADDHAARGFVGVVVGNGVVGGEDRHRAGLQGTGAARRAADGVRDVGRRHRFVVGAVDRVAVEEAVLAGNVDRVGFVGFRRDVQGERAGLRRAADLRRIPEAARAVGRGEVVQQAVVAHGEDAERLRFVPQDGRRIEVRGGRGDVPLEVAGLAGRGTDRGAGGVVVFRAEGEELVVVGVVGIDVAVGAVGSRAGAEDVVAGAGGRAGGVDLAVGRRRRDRAVGPLEDQRAGRGGSRGELDVRDGVGRGDGQLGGVRGSDDRRVGEDELVAVGRHAGVLRVVRIRVVPKHARPGAVLDADDIRQEADPVTQLVLGVDLDVDLVVRVVERDRETRRRG